MIKTVEQALERTRRCKLELAGNAARRQSVLALQAWQAQRLAATYADLRREAGLRRAVDFFLSDLYGGHEFNARDRSFERAWHLLRRALPPSMLEVLAAVSELQALTAELDLALASRLHSGEITPLGYLAAYREAGNLAGRGRQIDLVLEIGAALARAVRVAWVGLALRAAHAPAQLAGFGALQDFLERGYKSFRALGDPNFLLRTISDRERRLMRTLFAGPDAEALQLLQPLQPAGSAVNVEVEHG